MKSKIIFLICIFSFALSVRAQITFEKAYGGLDSEFGYSVRQTTDNGYILFGETESFSSSRDWYLIKTDEYGNTLWTKTYGSLNFDSGSEVQQTSDGGYVLCGTHNLQTKLIKTDTIGDTLWTKTHIGYGNSVEQTSDGGYAIAGDIWLGGPNYNMLLIKTDSNGDTIWTKTYGNNQSDGCRDFKQTNDGGYILTGYNSVGSTTDIFLVKTNSSGDTLWTKSFGGSGYEAAYSVEQTNDNGYIVLGNTNSFGGDKFYLIKTDANGDSLWTKIYDNGNSNDEGYEVKQTLDGGYAFVAETDKNGFTYEEVYLVKTDSIGDTLWTKTYRQGIGNGLQITTDGGYILLGFTSSFGAGMHDFYLIKTDSYGMITGIVNPELNNGFNFTAYPNPTAGTVTIEFNNSKKINHSLNLYELHGRLVRTITNITSNKIEIERKNLVNGLYIFNLLNDQQLIAVGKLMLE